MRRLILAFAAAASLALAATSPTLAARYGVPLMGLSYGEDDLQRLDYWPGPGPDAPLVVFVHGGGWKATRI